MKKEQKKIWIYAAIIFVSAIIVLLFTAYSQIRLTGNINDYKNQLSSETKEKSGFQLDLNSCLKLNSQLNDQIKSANSQIEEIQKEQLATKAELLKTQERNKKISTAYDSLIAADSAYKAGEISVCAKLLFEKCDAASLSETALKKYKYLKGLTYRRAAIYIYFTGYSKYKNADYKNALIDFQMSINLSKAEYISDDCYYFIAYCGYNTGDMKMAKDSMNTLLKMFPNSTYKDAANSLLSKIK